MARLTTTTLKSGLDELASRDPDIARALGRTGYPKLRRGPTGFPTLLRIICDQQLSTASAAAIWGRVETLVDPLTPDSFMATGDQELRAAGLSRQKVLYGRHLADSIVSGALQLDRLGRMDDDAAAEELIKIKGIGRWTADIYLLFALGRRDILPVDDLALVVAAQHLKGMEERPSRKAISDSRQAVSELWPIATSQMGCWRVLTQLRKSRRWSSLL